MRFAMACVDRNHFVFETFVQAGWQPVKLFTLPLHSGVEYNRDIIRCAQQRNIDIQLSPITEQDLRDLAERGCQALVVSTYGGLIPDWSGLLTYAINFHPSPLPEARGPYPIVRAILENRRRWGVTCHKLSERYDRGDILDAETFALEAGECHESLAIKTQMAARRLAARVAANVAELWTNARPQGKGSYWKRWSEADRTLDFSAPVASILRRIRAFGRLETIAKVGRATLYVRGASGWEEAHGHPPGALVHFDTESFVLAASDGYVALTEWSPLSINVTGGIAGNGMTYLSQAALRPICADNLDGPPPD